jgi:hypothetical protein
MTEDQSFFSNLYIAPVDTKFYRDICEPGIAHLATIDIFHVGISQGPFYRPRRVIRPDAGSVPVSAGFHGLGAGRRRGLQHAGLG